MKVSFVNPPVHPYRKIMRNFDCATESKGNYLYQPYDMLLMSAKIPPLWPLSFIDCVAGNLDFNYVMNQLTQDEPEIIVCALAATNWEQDLAFTRALREKFPEAYLLVFGDLFIEEPPCQAIAPLVDGIFTSPVMFSFETLATFKNRSEFISSEHNGFRNSHFYNRSDLKTPTQIQLSDVRHHLFKHPKYKWPFSHHLSYTTIFTAWGCPYSCSYCILNKFPNYWRDANEIIEEMRKVKKLGFKEIYIGDRSFGLPLQNVLTLLDKMIDEKFNFSWSTYFHPNQYNAELLDKMKLSGCHTIIVGIESSDIPSLKQFGRHVRLDQFNALIVHAQKIGMTICGDFIIGLPGDTKDSILKTIQYSLDLKLDFASFNIATPLAGSSIRALAIKEGKMELGEEQFDSLGRNKIVSVSGICAGDILRLRNQAVLAFYLRPGYLLKRLLKTTSLEHLIVQALEGLSLFKKSFIPATYTRSRP